MKILGQERILVEHVDVLEKSNFCDFDEPRKRAIIRKERLSPTSFPG